MTAAFPRRQVFSQFSTIGTEFTHKRIYAHYFGLPSGVGLLKLSSLRYSQPVSQFYWVYSPPQWLSPNPGSPSLGRGPAKPALSSCGWGGDRNSSTKRTPIAINPVFVWYVSKDTNVCVLTGWAANGLVWRVPAGWTDKLWGQGAAATHKTATYNTHTYYCVLITISILA